MSADLDHENLTLDDELTDFFVTADERQASRASYLTDSAFSPVAFSPSTMLGEGTVELLAFWVSDEEYAVDIREILELIKVPEITDVPRAPRFLIGLISLRGTVVPILDLRLILGLPVADVSRSSRVLVLRAGEDPVGILVDGVTSVVRLEQGVISNRPKALTLGVAEVIHGVGRIDERVLIILDTKAVVAVLEK